MHPITLHECRKSRGEERVKEGCDAASTEDGRDTRSNVIQVQEQVSGGMQRRTGEMDAQDMPSLHGGCGWHAFQSPAQADGDDRI